MERNAGGDGRISERKEYGKIGTHEQRDRREELRSMKKWPVDAAAVILRVAIGLIFIPHGFAKVFGSGGVAAFAQNLPSYGIPTALGYAAAYGELVCGVLIIVGLLTRLDAFLLACNMFVATFVVQLPDALHDPDAGANKFFGAMHATELPLSLFAGCIALLFIGGGRLSLDAFVFRKRKTAAENAAAQPAGGG